MFRCLIIVFCLLCTHSLYSRDWCGPVASELQSEIIPDYLDESVVAALIAAVPPLGLHCAAVAPPTLGRHAPLWRACKDHDICYGTLYENKGRCDRRFESNLKSICDDTYDGPLDLFNYCCKFVAETMAGAVRSFGNAPFDDAQEIAEEVVENFETIVLLTPSEAQRAMLAEACVKFTHRKDHLCFVELAVQNVVNRSGLGRRAKFISLHRAYLDSDPSEATILEALALDDLWDYFRTEHQQSEIDAETTLGPISILLGYLH